jgi:hypothetical protein
MLAGRGIDRNPGEIRQTGGDDTPGCRHSLMGAKLPARVDANVSTFGHWIGLPPCILEARFDGRPRAEVMAVTGGLKFLKT